MQNVVTTESFQAFRKKWEKNPQTKQTRCEKLTVMTLPHLRSPELQVLVQGQMLFKSIASSWISCEPFLLFLLRSVRVPFILPISIVERWLNWSFPSGKVYVRTISQRVTVTFCLQGGWQFLYFMKNFLSWNLILQFITCETDLFWRSVFSCGSCTFERKVRKKNTRDHKTITIHSVIQQETEGQEEKKVKRDLLRRGWGEEAGKNPCVLQGGRNHLLVY